MVSHQKTRNLTFTVVGCVIAQALSCWPIIMEARVQAHANPCWTCSRQTIAGRGFSPGTLVFLCQNHSTSTPNSFIHSSPTLEILANEDAVKKHN